MPIPHICPRCKFNFTLDDSYARLIVKCPKCEGSVGPDSATRKEDLLDKFVPTKFGNALFSTIDSIVMFVDKGGNNLLKLLFWGFILLVALGLWKKADKDEKRIDEEMRLREQNPHAVIQRK